MSPLRAFVSFDCERDTDLFPKLLAQSKKRDSPIHIFDRSTADSLNPECEDVLRQRLSRVDLVIVICGNWTHRSVGVSNELRVAQELGKPYFFIKGRFGECALPMPSKIDDKLYRWNWINVCRLATGQR
jgi:hypothetical protein